MYFEYGSAGSDTSSYANFLAQSSLNGNFNGNLPNNGHMLYPERKRKEGSPIIEEENPDLQPPKPKRRTTEEKMSAKLRNFHITNYHQSDRHMTDAFFMKRPQETLEEMEARLSDDEEEETTASSSNIAEEPSLEVNPEFRKYLKAQRNSFSPWLKTPDSSMAVVLWQPSNRFVDGILQKASRIQEIDPDDHDPTRAPNGYCNIDPEISYPSSPEEEADPQLQSFIQELPPSSAEMEEDAEMEEL